MDLRFGDQPVWIASVSGPLLAIPYALELNDSTTMIGRGLDATSFADAVIDEFDELLSSGASLQVMSVILHSFISGVPFRLRQVRRALEHIAAHADVVWLTQPNAIHEAFTAVSPPTSAPEALSFLTGASATPGSPA